MSAVKFEVVLKRTLLGATLGWLLIVSGCAAVQQSNSGNSGTGGGGPVTGPASASVSFCNAAQVNCQSQSASFSLTTSNIPDVNIFVDWANVTSGTHSQEMRLLMPNGNLFQRLQNTFVVARNGNGSARVNRIVPIAGSFISQRRITGGWKVKVSLDGKAVTTGDLRLDP
jgi:hypothetical protein